MSYILHLSAPAKLVGLAWAAAERTAAALEDTDKLARVKQRIQSQLDLSCCKWDAAHIERPWSESSQDRTVDSASSLLGSLSNIAINYYQAQYTQMIHHARSLIVRAANYGNSQYIAWGHAGHALGLWRSGSRSAALTALRESVAHVERSGDFLCQLLVYAVTAQLSLEQGDPAVALVGADKALVLHDRGTHTGQGMLEGYASLVEVYLQLWRSTDDAIRKADLAKKLQRASAALRKYAQTYQMGRPRSALYAGLEAQSSGNNEQALALFMLCINRAARLQMPYEEGRGQLALAAALPKSDARRPIHLQEALASFSRIGAKYEEQRVCQLLIS